MVGAREEREQVEAVIQGWMSSLAENDRERLNSLWDQEYQQLIYIAEENNDALLSWGAISKYYDAFPDMVESGEFSLGSLMVDVLGDAAYAYCTFLAKVNIKGIDHPMVFDARNTFVLRRSGGRWKIIHYHESLSKDHSHDTWGFLWS